MTSKKIAVTGATGLVGSHLVAELLRQGYRDITLPVRNPQRLANLYKTLEREGVARTDANFKIVETELNNPVTLKACFCGIDTVFNCAAAVSLGAMDEHLLIDGNIEIAKHVVNAALECGVGRLVHVSSIAALGPAPEGKKYIDESTCVESLAGMSAYSTGKFLSENEIWRGSEIGLKATVVNPAVILGAGDWRSGSTALAPLMTLGIPFYTEGVTAMVDVRDVARAMIALANSDAAIGERYILSGGDISYREFLTLAALAAGRKPPRIKAGRFALGAAWRAAWLWGRLTGSKPLLNKELSRIVTNKTYHSTEKIKNTVNFEFTPLADTIDRIVKQYLTEKNG